MTPAFTTSGTTSGPTMTQERRPLPEATERVCVDDVCFDNIDSETGLTIIRQYLAETTKTGARLVCFANVHSIHIARHDHELRYALHRADLVLPDGSGLALAGSAYGLPVRENLNGTDFIPRLLADMARNGRSVFLLGAQLPVVTSCCRVLPLRYPGLVVAGSHHGHFSEEEDESIVNAINAAQPDVLLIGLGTPFQEFWMMRFASRLQVKVCLSVGGLFDFLSGEKMRAPRWMRRLGIEWLFRFLHEPGRKWDRVLVEIPIFLLRTITRQIAVTKGQPRIHGTHIHTRRQKE
jgi:N-acetylglucosaminyldiphosphoundecaprenol N-acetyl-beta-D-mannosaminyltransferase